MFSQKVALKFAHLERLRQITCLAGGPSRRYRLASAASMPALTSALANSAATRMPFMMARSFDEPCPTITGPANAEQLRAAVL